MTKTHLKALTTHIENAGSCNQAGWIFPLLFFFFFKPGLSSVLSDLPLGAPHAAKAKNSQGEKSEGK